MNGDDIFGWLDTYLNRINKSAYLYVIVAFNVAYLLFLMGYSVVEKNVLDDVRYGIQMFLCVYLMIRFNPFRTHAFEKGDARIIFGSAMLLFTNMLGGGFGLSGTASPYGRKTPPFPPSEPTVPHAAPPRTK